ncbi:DUF4294 domain-containing protein [Bacteroidales bacterium OttesenSCG-928-M11]|nr:DUF4294 domain-containing protein [Bacteroidales bacterium OttesenSCG-928-M11]
MIANIPYRFFVLRILLFFGLFYSWGNISAQTDFKNEIPEYVITQHGDTIRTMIVGDVYIYPKQAFKNEKQEERYNKLVRDIKKTLPYAKMIYATLIETYEYMQTLPDDKAREAHMKRMEKELYAEYKPVLKKMTLSQGKLLIKLIDRECNQTSYTLIKTFLGSFRAGFWNIFASMFGASLKSEWDPDGKDANAERIIQMVELGLI